MILPEDPEATADAVLQLLSDAELRGQMGLAARAWVAKHFADEDVLRLVTRYYGDLLNSSEVELESGLVSESVVAR